MFRRRSKKTALDMFGRAVDANTTSPSQTAPSPDDASADRSVGHGQDRSCPEKPSDIRRNWATLSLADKLEAFGRGTLWTGDARAARNAQSANEQYLAERAAKCEQAAERFRLAGDEKMAASFAQEAAELRRAGA